MELPEARKALEGMADLDIEHCEEPIHAENLPDQVRINAESPIPIMADEAVFTSADAIRIIAANAANMINIKLGKSGGIHNAMKIAAIAEAADMYCQVGSFLRPASACRPWCILTWYGRISYTTILIHR